MVRNLDRMLARPSVRHADQTSAALLAVLTERVARMAAADLPLAEIVEGLNRFDPTDLFAYPSMMHRLAGEMRRGRLRISPWELNCGAEPLLADAPSLESLEPRLRRLLL